MLDLFDFSLCMVSLQCFKAKKLELHFSTLQELINTPRQIFIEQVEITAGWRTNNSIFYAKEEIKDFHGWELPLIKSVT